MEIVNQKSSIRSRHGFYSELYTDEEVKHLARAYRKKHGDKRLAPLLDEQKFLRIVILHFARLLNFEKFDKDDLTTFEKILSAIGHLATLERVRIAAESGKGGDIGDTILEALAAMDIHKLT